jgi:hypothetical protein
MYVRIVHIMRHSVKGTGPSSIRTADLRRGSTGTRYMSPSCARKWVPLLLDSTDRRKRYLLETEAGILHYRTIGSTGFHFSQKMDSISTRMCFTRVLEERLLMNRYWFHCDRFHRDQKGDIDR